MRLREVRISGFKPIPYSAAVRAVEGARGRQAPVQIEWDKDAFRLTLPTRAIRAAPMLNAIMGANSAGKSSILSALQHFFGSAARLEEWAFHGKRQEQPVIIEVTATGPIADVREWHTANCMQVGHNYDLTVAHVWTADGRQRYIRRANGLYYKQAAHDRSQCDALLPQFRIVWADSRLRDEADLDKKNLIGDLIDGLLANSEDGQSVVAHLHDALHILQRLIDRAAPPSDVSWRQVEDLERRLSQRLGAVTPQENHVRLKLADDLLSVRDFFAKGAMLINDGVELDFEQHGLGLQRSFVVSTLHAWCDLMANAEHDYVFAIEEPEIYLHPHATRVMLNTLETIARRHQVLFTTHASEFINRVPLHNIVAVRRGMRDGAMVSHITRPSLNQLTREEASKVQRYLWEDRSDMLFARAALLVEGQAELFSMPAFARTLGMDLDATGVSIVFVNGIGNFATYHQILEAFHIPHVILMDGDRHKAQREREYRQCANALFVLKVDFEHLLVETLSKARLLELMNECQQRRGKPPKTSCSGTPAHLARELASLGKPLVGRVAGELLTRTEVERMTPLVESLHATLRLAAQPALASTVAPTSQQDKRKR